MIKTIVSILLSLGVILGLSLYEILYVQTTFRDFEQILTALHQKTESHVATYEDGNAVRFYWEKKKRTLHVWLTHTTLQEVDYHLDEAIGYLYTDDFRNAVSQLEIAIELSKEIPRAYSLGIQNIF